MAVGVFGGTFDPVHIGHLRTAVELKDALGLDRMVLIPSGDPPHRETPMTPAARRLAMVELAIDGEPGVVVDSREVEREGRSYSIDTLIELRRELGSDQPLCFCIGLDSLLSLPTWHRWREFLHYAHIVVAVRPGWELPEAGEVGEWLDRNRVKSAGELLARPAGGVWIDEMTLLPISATEIRALLARGKSARYLTPDAVIGYIREHRLYV